MPSHPSSVPGRPRRAPAPRTRGRAPRDQGRAPRKLTAGGLHRSAGLLLGLAFLSGLSALVYESLWIRWFRLLFGSTTYASSATLCSFFAGLAIGALLFGRLASRVRNPLRTYAYLELAVAVSALWVPLAIRFYDPIYATLYEHLSGSRGLFVAVKLALALVAMLPTSILLGGTLPMLGTALLGEGSSLGRQGSRLYAVNTLGAALGAPLGAVLLPEWVGIPATYAIAIGATLLVALLSWRLASRLGPATARDANPSSAPESAHTGSGDTPPARRADAGPMLIAAASGFGILAYEVLLIHALGQVYTHSAYSYGLVFVLVLVGLGLGAFIVSATSRRIGTDQLLRTCLLTMAGLLAVFPFALNAFGPWVTVLGFFTFLVGGMVFPLTFRKVSGGPVGARIGGLLAANTVGGILGSVAASFVLLVYVGLWASVAWLAVLYALAAVAVGGAPRARLAALSVAIVLFAGLRFSPLDPWSVPTVRLMEGETVLVVEEGATGIVSVVEDASGNRRIKVDDSYQFGDSRNQPLAERMAHLPMLLHPDPRHVAVIGSATGTVAGGVLLHPVDSIEMVEIVPEVQQLAAEWFADFNRGVHHDPRTRLVTEDGRNHLRAAPTRYDVIVEDMFVPSRPTAAAMYTREHYEDAREHLTGNGIFCQWLPVYQLDEPTFLVILSTFLEVFPEGSLWRPHMKAHRPAIALIGSTGPMPTADQVEARTQDLLALGIEDPWVTDPAAVWLLYAGAGRLAFDVHERPPVHHDGHPFFEFMTARHTPATLELYRYLGWVQLMNELAQRSAVEDALFPARPPELVLGANAWLRANLAYVAGAKDHMQTSWNEAARLVPAHLLLTRDESFADLWPAARD